MMLPQKAFLRSLGVSATRWFLGCLSDDSVSLLPQSALLRRSASLAVLAVALTLPVYASDYHLGEGYNIGSLNVSGYSNVVAEFPNKGISALTIDDFSIFLSGRFNRWFNPFVEFELSNAPLFTESSGFFERGTPRMVLERAYNDFLLTPEWTFRLGKMLSPVGEWNQIHAAPLVWTTVRPLTTYYNFSEFTSGMSLLYNDPDGHLPDVQIYYQPSDNIVREPRSVKRFQYRNVGGFNLAFTNDLQKRLGLSMQHAENSDTEEAQWLASMDGRISFGSLTLESQWTRTWVGKPDTSSPWSSNPGLQHPQRNEWGGYVQAIYGLDEHWNLVTRGETFQSRYANNSSEHWLVGVVYRPVSAISWKVEYVETSGAQLDISRGLYASMAVLF